MIRISCIIILTPFLNVAYAQISMNMEKVFQWSSNDTNVTGYNDVWGYQADGKEYAIIGSNWGTHFIDVTPGLTNSNEIASFVGKADDVTWRDYKTYLHYAYGVADGDNNSLQIFDLQYLPDSVVKVYDDSLASESSHNIFIENERIYFCSNKISQNKSFQSLDVWSLANPENPTHLKAYADTFFGNNLLHDLYVRNDIAYCSAGYGGMYTYDLSDLDNPVLKLLLDVYAEQGYNHSSWLSDDGSKMVLADEVPSGLAMKLFDVTDLDDIELLDIFHSNDLATPHNPYFSGDKIITSYYLDGVQVFDYSNKYKVKRVAYYDTYPDDTSYLDFNSYSGCWGVYPFLDSKNVLGSDRTYGLFVLDINETALIDISENELVKHLEILPNLVESSFSIESSSPIKTYYIFDKLGRMVTLKKELIDKKIINFCSDLIPGNYIVAVVFEDGTSETQRIIKK